MAAVLLFLALVLSLDARASSVVMPLATDRPRFLAAATRKPSSG